LQPERMFTKKKAGYGGKKQGGAGAVGPSTSNRRQRGKRRPRERRKNHTYARQKGGGPSTRVSKRPSMDCVNRAGPRQGVRSKRARKGRGGETDRTRKLGDRRINMKGPFRRSKKKENPPEGGRKKGEKSKKTTKREKTREGKSRSGKTPINKGCSQKKKKTSSPIGYLCRDGKRSGDEGEGIKNTR